MKTYEDKRAALDREHAAKLRALDVETKIGAALPEFMHAYNVATHAYALYDRIASVEINYNAFRVSTDTTPDPTWQTLRDVAAGFTFADLAIFRDGSVGVRTLADAQAEYVKAEKRNPDTSAEVHPIAPFWISIEPARYSNTCTFHTIVMLADVGMVELRIAYPNHGAVARAIGKVEIRRALRPASEHYEHSRIVSQDLTLNEPIRVLGNAKAVTLRYGSGSAETPGQHLIYWDSCDGEPADITIGTLIAKLESVGELK